MYSNILTIIHLVYSYCYVFIPKSSLHINKISPSSIHKVKKIQFYIFSKHRLVISAGVFNSIEVQFSNIQILGNNTYEVY